MSQAIKIMSTIGKVQVAAIKGDHIQLFISDIYFLEMMARVQATVSRGGHTHILGNKEEQLRKANEYYSTLGTEVEPKKV